MLFIHGGGFENGYGGGILYNSTNFANLTNHVIVSMNYRLGALGFLYDQNIGLRGNYGYMDQVMQATNFLFLFTQFRIFFCLSFFCVFVFFFVYKYFKHI